MPAMKELPSAGCSCNPRARYCASEVNRSVAEREEAMDIRRAMLTDRDALLDVWLRSVDFPISSVVVERSLVNYA
jgi:hypothetical protein